MRILSIPWIYDIFFSVYHMQQDNRGVGGWFKLPRDLLMILRRTTPLGSVFTRVVVCQRLVY